MEKKVVVDHYQVLGLPSGEEGAKLEDKEITKAYRAKALKLHPDKRPNDPNANAEFQRLNASYEILNDPNARKQFDSSLRLEDKPSEPTPTSEPPPSKNEDLDQGYLFVVGLLIFVLAPMVFPESRSRSSTSNRLGSYIEGFFKLPKRERLDLWSGMIRLGQYFKRRPPPPQATTNQEPQVEDHEDNQESLVEDHEDIEDWVMV
ncbi:uncharacterized protein LOC133729364 [Rosa rugosa]|uniref:uncharacterized protein LOC133729364 n=1 Tax=Rosa rugosa TaxID=74645 RepID=UPI002B4069EE|nr:uncharacterized protein LOC133729364 [Rosa rugosa]